MAERMLFVAGTGTGVGKTYVASALCAALRRAGRATLAAKPVETGTYGPQDPESDMARLARAAGSPPGLGSCYALRKPASPHLAAALEGTTIEPARLLAALRAAARPGALLLVEGAGGLRVPLRPGYEMIDLVRDLGAPLLLVGRAGLGGLNEALLSLEAIARRGLPLAGTVLSEPQPAEDREIALDNLSYLRRHAPGPVLGLLPFGAERLEDHVDLPALCARLDAPDTQRPTPVIT